MDYKLLVSDLDSTLISQKHGLTDKNKKAIKKAIDSGLKFFICSGRSYLSLERFEKELGINKEGFYTIAFNGNTVCDSYKHKVIYEKMLDGVLAQQIIAKLKNYDVFTIVYVRDILYAQNVTDENAYEYIEEAALKITEIKLDTIDTDVSKIILRADRKTLQKVFDDMSIFIEGKCNMFYSADNLLEFTNLEATKGKALAFLADHLNINKKHIIAVGDNHNDLSMIEFAGLGIAVKNAVDEAKEIADYVTTVDNENDAIAEIIEKFIFENGNLT